MMAELNVFVALASIFVLGTTALHIPRASVVCTETGFTPKFVQGYDQGRIVAFEVTVGNGDSGCGSKKDILGNDKTTVIDGKAIKGDKKNGQLAYKIGDEVTCGGDLEYNKAGTTIDYSVPVTVVVTETHRAAIKRSLKYNFLLKCHLTREVSAVSSKTGWEASGVLSREGDVIDVAESFNLATSLRFFDSRYKVEKAEQFELTNDQRLYIRIQEDRKNTLFKIVINDCWSTPNPNANYDVRDLFFSNKCPVDETVTFTDPKIGDQKFDIHLKTFFFAAEPDSAIHVHCSIFICKAGDLTDDRCVQPTKSQCRSKRRRRRSVSGADIEERVLSSYQKIVYDQGDIFTPVCNDGYVFDRITKSCTNNNLLEIQGIELRKEWNPLYANTSSNAFKKLARDKGYQLYTLLQAAGRDQHIHGIKVVRAHKGGVVLDVVIKHDGSITTEHAFAEFEEALRHTKPQVSRVINLLNVRQDKIIEFVPIIVKSAGTGAGVGAFDQSSLIQVILIVMGALLLLMAGFALLRQQRRKSKDDYSTIFVPEKINSM